MKEMSRRRFIENAGLGMAGLYLMGAQGCATETKRKPNIIYILADDLGYNELGAYGQKKIKTPNIDKLAAEGMKFTQHYAGCPVCAPSRCTLLTGKDTGHSYIRDNDEMSDRGDVWHDPALEGQRPLPANTQTIGTILQKAGYKTACIGKWGLGGPDSTGHPNKQGFDHFFGFLCQRQAHNYYPDHLWRNDQKVVLEGNKPFFPHQKFPKDKDPNDPAAYAQYKGEQYAPDLMAEEALQFIRENKDQPFFLYFATTVPHLALQVPDESLEQYKDAFDDKPYLGDRGYLPNRTPRATYAAMISRMDRDVGRMVDLIKKLGLEEDTLIIFTSDNGTTYTGGVDYEFFNSVDSLRGLKGRVYEGGIRVPMIARWKGHIKPNSVSDQISAFWDMLPTFCDVAGVPAPDDTNGIDMLPTFLDREKKQEHKYLYWEFRAYSGQQAVRMGKWKGVRTGLKKKNSDTRIQLYDLDNDLSEKNNIADKHPEIVEKIEKIMRTARTKSKYFSFPEIYEREF